MSEFEQTRARIRDRVDVAVNVAKEATLEVVIEHYRNEENRLMRAADLTTGRQKKDALATAFYARRQHDHLSAVLAGLKTQAA